MIKVNGAVERRILRVDGDQWQEADDLLIVERTVRLVLDGEERAQTVMTPGHEDWWALGHLRCLGAIETSDDVESLEIKDDIVQCRRRGAHCASAVARTQTIRDHPCDGEMRKVVRDGIRWLSEAPLYTSTGAAHVAALVKPDGRRLVRIEDVGRHNAVDKAIGWALANKINLAETILLTSGRLPEDMVAKGIAAGVLAMASVSAATAQGAALAERHGMILIGFVRGERMNVYSGYSSVIRASSSCVL